MDIFNVATRLINILLGISTLGTVGWGILSFASDMKSDVSLLKSQMEIVRQELAEIRGFFEPRKAP